MPSFGKSECGYNKRKKRKRIEKLIMSQRGALDKFVIKESQVSLENQVGDGNESNDTNAPLENLNVSGDDNDLNVCLENLNDVVDNNVNVSLDNLNANVDANNSLEILDANVDDNGANGSDQNQNVNGEDNDVIAECDNSIDVDDINFDDNYDDCNVNADCAHIFDIFDPRNWDSLDAKMIDILVAKGPKRDLSIQKGPKNKYSRRFSSIFYTRVLPNGEKCDRDWLVYSKELDKVFCFCCKIFKQVGVKGQLVMDGFGDWTHLSIRLKEHETSAEHVKNMTTWYELSLRLKKNQTIDKVAQKHLEKEKEHWRKVLVRIIFVVKFLARNSLAFRGHKERLYENSNGNFLGLIEMLAEFDPIIQEHVQRIIKDKLHFHYLGHKIQNELVLLLASTIKSEIIKNVEKAKYFSVILDCTPDISHQEQMSLILRYVDCSSTIPSIEESFLGFLDVNDTTGQGLFDVLQCELKSLGLDIDNIHGQSYDNGSNMKGKNQGVQQRLLDVNPRAFHTSCASHSLNLELCDMANTCGKARDFFGIIQRIYTIFANSTKRWHIFKEHVKDLTVKSLSSTRWESRVDSVKAIRFQILEMREALLEVAESDNDSKIRSEAKSLAQNELGDYEFLVSIVIWYEILYAINLVSKDLQSKDMLIDIAIEKIKGLISFFVKYRDSGYLNALETAKEIAIKLNVDPVFPQRRVIRRKKQFDETPDDAPLGDAQSALDLFKVNYFLYIVDQAISSLTIRFEQYEEYENIFGFLFTSHKLHSLDDMCLNSSCGRIQIALEKYEKSDIDGNELCVELKLLKEILPEEVMLPIEILKFLKLYACFPNATIVYRILLTISVTVASAERSFSKLKLVKTYLRSTMTQERLNGLALISTEKDLLEKIDNGELIERFVSNNVRRMVLFN